MPYTVHRLKNGKVRVVTKSTGKSRTFKSRAAFEKYARVAEAVKHGWRPSERHHKH